VILRAAVVVVTLFALSGCCSAPARDHGTFRRQSATLDPKTVPLLPGWPDGWYYERVVDAGGGRGGYGATKAEAMRNAGGVR